MTACGKLAASSMQSRRSRQLGNDRGVLGGLDESVETLIKPAGGANKV